MKSSHLIIVVLLAAIAFGAYKWNEERNTTTIQFGDSTIKIEK